MKSKAEIDPEILKDPRNYAAIYARISSKKDNNSIDAQINEAKSALNDKNLLVYGIYTDHISGRTVPPPLRKGFGKLLEDAKAGCFKTIIAYRHDRLVRNLNDWVNLKNQLNRLGVKIIFSDETEYTPEESIQGDFLENLIIMVAELEPDNINERVSNGKKQRRMQGVYSAGGKCPFGYKREEVGNTINSKNSKSNIKSIYKVDPLKAIFIQHLFWDVKIAIEEGSVKMENIKRTMLSFIEKFEEASSLDNLKDLLSSYAGDLKIMQGKPVNSEIKQKEFSKHLKKHLQDKTEAHIKEELQSIKKYISSTSNLQTLIRNPIYGGYHLIDAKEEDKGITIDEESFFMRESSFKKLINVTPIIDKETLKVVYPYAHKTELLKEKEPDYIFKGKLKCGCCGTILHMDGVFLKCSQAHKRKGCLPFARTSVLESVLEIIMDDAFKKSDQGFNHFADAVKEKLKQLRTELQQLRNKKMLLLKEYLKKKGKIYVDSVQHNQKEINALLHKISAYADEMSYVNRLRGVISYYNRRELLNEIPSPVISRIRSSVISYILSNQAVFSTIFDNLINEIRVNIIENEEKCRITINYEFSYKEPGHISENIN